MEDGREDVVGEVDMAVLCFWSWYHIVLSDYNCVDRTLEVRLPCDSCSIEFSLALQHVLPTMVMVRIRYDLWGCGEYDMNHYEAVNSNAINDEQEMNDAMMVYPHYGWWMTSCLKVYVTSYLHNKDA